MGCVLTKVPKTDERALTGLIAKFLSISRPFTKSTTNIFVGAIQFSVEEIERDTKNLKKVSQVR